MQDFMSALAAGVPQIGLSVAYPSPGAVERIGPDWDWMWIDGQHGQLGYSDVQSIIRACDLIQKASIVRVPGQDFGVIGMTLDAGATGLIVPCVDTPEQARAVVDAAKFPPIGKRSYGSRRLIDRLGRAYSNEANQRTLLVVQIESPQALENVDAIAAVPGVDALFFGPDDTLLRRGIAMDIPRTPQMLRQYMDPVVAACKKHRKYNVMIGVGKEMIAWCVSMGANMIVGGADVAFLVSASKTAAAELRAGITPQAPSRDGAPKASGSIY